MEISKDTEAMLKRKEVSLLCSFIDVCEKLGLEYFAVGGTLLGAVRHSGFIPWDDDIDVGMKRKDYEVFKQKAQDLLPQNVFVQNFETDEECPINFIKLRDSTTTFIETSVCKLTMNHGVYIDVFPFDVYPEDERKQRDIDIYNKLLTKRIGKVFYKTKNKVKISTKITDIIALLIYPQLKNALLKRDSLYRRYEDEDSGLLINFCGAWGRKEIAKAEWFSSTKSVLFEEIEIKIPVGYVDYLSNLYGDYNQLPPEEKRISHHYTEVIDLYTPYTKYIGKRG